MRNINKEIEMNDSQMASIHVYASELLSENKIEEANQWIAMWEDILHDIEVLTMIKRNTSVVEILIEDIYLNQCFLFGFPTPPSYIQATLKNIT